MEFRDEAHEILREASFTAVANKEELIDICSRNLPFQQRLVLKNSKRCLNLAITLVYQEKSLMKRLRSLVQPFIQRNESQVPRLLLLLPSPPLARLLTR